MNPPDKDLILSFYDSYVNDWLEHNKKKVDQIDQEAKDRSELGLPLDLASHFKPRPTTMWNENKTLTRIKIAREMLLTLTDALDELLKELSDVAARKGREDQEATKAAFKYWKNLKLNDMETSAFAALEHLAAYLNLL